MSDINFEQRKTIEQVEESTELAPKFDRDGLIPVVTTDFNSGEVLMQGYMNEEAFKKTISLGEAVYYSRSRETLWHKGKTSGLVQKIKEIRIDDDQDSVWILVDIANGASCHVGYRSCFYRSIPLGKIKNTEEIINKANRYSTLGAIKLNDVGKKGSVYIAFIHALWSFIKHYFFKLGFLDGGAGLVIAFGNFEGTFYRYIKLTEKQSNWKPPSTKPILKK